MRICNVLIAVALTGLLWASAHMSVAWAQPPASTDLQADAVFLAWRGEPSVQACGVCHYSPGNLFAERDTDFCRLDEVKQWLQNDKHAIARQRIEPIAPSEQAEARQRIQHMLQSSANSEIEVPESWISESNFLSAAICKQLGYDIQTEEGYAKFRENCLTCHGGYESERDAETFARDRPHHPGISCLYCHQEGDDSRWIDEHSGFQAKQTWRALPPHEKAEKGMRNLVTADAQSQLCFRCHIGDLDHNMFVTHEMYAAGHPPLPSVELSTLVEHMPRHWRSHDELYKKLERYPQRAAYFTSNIPALGELPEEQVRIDQLPWQTASMVTGALAAQQQSLRLLAQAAEPDSRHWGDYALYDCAACHHELRIPSERQSIRRQGTPGRPRPAEWPQALSQAAGAAAGVDESLATLQMRLTQAVTQRPFGDREAVARSAAEVDKALKQIKLRLAAHALSDSFSRDMLAALAQTPDELLVGYHAARQINWAIRGIDAELAKLRKPLPSQVRAAISELGKDPATGSELVSTALPAGIHQAIYPEFVQMELARQANYDSQQFAKQLKTLATLLGSEPASP